MLVDILLIKPFDRAQIAEGTKNADITGPRGIILAVGSAMIQGVVLCIAALFSIQDVEELRSSAAPVATLFLRATNRPLTVFFLVILALTQFASECNSFYSCAQLLWAMSRDKCIPLHSFWYKLSGKNKVPARILILEGLVCIVVIMPVRDNLFIVGLQCIVLNEAKLRCSL